MKFTRKPPANCHLYCCVKGCTSLSKRSRQLSFHHFPFPRKGQRKVLIKNEMGNYERVDIRKRWISVLNIGKQPSASMRVCSLHFVEEDFCSYEGKVRKRLRRVAFPTQNLPVSQPGCEKSEKPIDATLSVTSQTTVDETAEEIRKVIQTECTGYCEESQNTYTEEEKLVAEALLSLCEKTLQDVAVQVNTDKIKTVSQCIATDDHLNALTGLHSLKLLDGLEKTLEMVLTDLRLHRLSIRDRIILTMMKLKNNLTYVVLSILFGGITSQTCKNIFFETVPKLSQVLCSMVYWPSKHEILSNMPNCFEKYNDVRIVLDCTEIFIQSPKCLCCQIKTYSQYKSSQTVKYMIGVSPAGLITFLSLGYGGRASDKAIFLQSRIIEKLIPHQDAVMVDKGFLIDQICDDYAIKLIRPPFLKNKKQLTAEETKVNSCIASARVHIERVNQRIKIFKIVSGKLDWSLVPLIDNIMIILCGICNLSNPILSEKRFKSDV